jgi:hypothetical protein
MHLINDSNKSIKLPGGTCFGFAQIIDKGYHVDPILAEVACIRKMDSSISSDQTLPYHLVDLFQRS